MSKNVREVALDSLLHIEKNQSYSNLLLNQMIQKHDMDRRDIGLLTEIVYGTIQRKEALRFYLKPFVKNPKKVQDWVYMLLCLSLYQIVYLDRIPERAVIHEAVNIAKKRGHKGISGFVNGVLRNIQREGLPSFATIEDPVERIAIEASYPLWLIRRWVKLFGYDVTKQMCEVSLLPPPITARVNWNKVDSFTQLIEILDNEGVVAEAGDLSPDAIKINKGNLAHTMPFREGHLTVQDESSMLVARALDIHEGQVVLDSCGAPGGKTTHIAETLEATGKVISVDLHPHKVKLINEQVDRLQLRNVETKVLDSRKLKESFKEESFDRILVDAPCTGFGVIRRKPDIKYSKTEADIVKLAGVQFDILQSVAPLLKKGGKLVYSTCTIDAEENAGVISRFLESHADFEKDFSLSERLPDKLKPYIQDGQVQILPHYFGTDGFYIAALKRRE